MSENIDRRKLVKAAAWAMPVVALSAAAPMAAASTPTPNLYCSSGDTDVKDVQVRNGVLYITFADTAQNSVDVTIRQEGEAEQHFNFVPAGTPTNGVPHMKNYTAGEVVAIQLPRAYSLQRDWMQIKTIHNENCVVVS